MQIQRIGVSDIYFAQKKKGHAKEIAISAAIIPTIIATGAAGATTAQAKSYYDSPVAYVSYSTPSGYKQQVEIKRNALETIDEKADEWSSWDKEPQKFLDSIGGINTPSYSGSYSSQNNALDNELTRIYQKAYEYDKARYNTNIENFIDTVAPNMGDFKKPDKTSCINSTEKYYSEQAGVKRNALNAIADTSKARYYTRNSGYKIDATGFLNYIGSVDIHYDNGQSYQHQSEALDKELKRIFDEAVNYDDEKGVALKDSHLSIKNYLEDVAPNLGDFKTPDTLDDTVSVLSSIKNSRNTKDWKNQWGVDVAGFISHIGGVDTDLNSYDTEKDNISEKQSELERIYKAAYRYDKKQYHTYYAGSVEKYLDSFASNLSGFQKPSKN